MLGLPGCGDQKPCPLHDRWAVERGRLKSLFESLTLAVLGETFRSGECRLKALTETAEGP